jgi:hypothetical protein
MASNNNKRKRVNSDSEKTNKKVKLENDICLYPEIKTHFSCPHRYISSFIEKNPEHKIITLIHNVCSYVTILINRGKMWYAKTIIFVLKNFVQSIEKKISDNLFELLVYLTINVQNLYRIEDCDNDGQSNSYTNFIVKLFKNTKSKNVSCLFGDINLIHKSHLKIKRFNNDFISIDTDKDRLIMSSYECWKSHNCSLAEKCNDFTEYSNTANVEEKYKKIHYTIPTNILNLINAKSRDEYEKALEVIVTSNKQTSNSIRLKFEKINELQNTNFMTHNAIKKFITNKFIVQFNKFMQYRIFSHCIDNSFNNNLMRNNMNVLTHNLLILFDYIRLTYPDSTLMQEILFADLSQTKQCKYLLDNIIYFFPLATPHYCLFQVLIFLQYYFKLYELIDKTIMYTKQFITKTINNNIATNITVMVFWTNVYKSSNKLLGLLNDPESYNALIKEFQSENEVLLKYLTFDNMIILQEQTLPIDSPYYFFVCKILQYITFIELRSIPNNQDKNFITKCESCAIDNIYDKFNNSNLSKGFIYNNLINPFPQSCPCLLMIVGMLLQRCCPKRAKYCLHIPSINELMGNVLQLNVLSHDDYRMVLINTDVCKFDFMAIYTRPSLLYSKRFASTSLNFFDLAARVKQLLKLINSKCCVNTFEYVLYKLSNDSLEEIQKFYSIVTKVINLDEIYNNVATVKQLTLIFIKCIVETQKDIILNLIEQQQRYIVQTNEITDFVAEIITIIEQIPWLSFKIKDLILENLKTNKTIINNKIIFSVVYNMYKDCLPLRQFYHSEDLNDQEFIFVTMKNLFNVILSNHEKEMCQKINDKRINQLIQQTPMQLEENIKYPHLVKILFLLQFCQIYVDSNSINTLLLEPKNKIIISDKIITTFKYIKLWTDINIPNQKIKTFYGIKNLQYKFTQFDKLIFCNSNLFNLEKLDYSNDELIFKHSKQPLKLALSEYLNKNLIQKDSKLKTVIEQHSTMLSSHSIFSHNREWFDIAIFQNCCEKKNRFDNNIIKLKFNSIAFNLVAYLTRDMQFSYLTMIMKNTNVSLFNTYQSITQNIGLTLQTADDINSMTTYANLRNYCNNLHFFTDLLHNNSYGYDSPVYRLCKYIIHTNKSIDGNLIYNADDIFSSRNTSYTTNASNRKFYIHLTSALYYFHYYFSTNNAGTIRNFNIEQYSKLLDKFIRYFEKYCRELRYEQMRYPDNYNPAFASLTLIYFLLHVITMIITKIRYADVVVTQSYSIVENFTTAIITMRSCLAVSDDTTIMSHSKYLQSISIYVLTEINLICKIKKVKTNKNKINMTNVRRSKRLLNRSGIQVASEPIPLHVQTWKTDFIKYIE